MFDLFPLLTLFLIPVLSMVATYIGVNLFQKLPNYS